ncbi:hypothetical protein JOD18_002537 [Gracilibacillus alcaliphilus]|nr:hypothetical protein [Gracilibacillus alcaliphilus]
MDATAPFVFMSNNLTSLLLSFNSWDTLLFDSSDNTDEKLT